MHFNKVKIENLLGQYSVEIDIRKGCNILLGANGIGKTTILRILDSISKNDYLDLLGIKFDRIIINMLYFDYYEKYYQDTTFVLKSDDLYPDRETFKSGLLQFLNDEIKWNVYTDQVSQICKKAEAFLQDIDKAGLYYMLIDDLIHTKKCAAEIKKICWDNDIIDSDFELLRRYSSKLVRNIYNITFLSTSEFEKCLYDKKYKWGGHKNSKCFIDFFIPSEFLHESYSDSDGSIFYLDLVKGFEFKEEKYTYPVFHSNILSWIKNSNSVVVDTDDIHRRGIYHHDRWTLREMEYYSYEEYVPLGYSRYFLSKGGTELIEFLKKTFRDVTDISADRKNSLGHYIGIERYIIDQFSSDRVFDVNSLIAFCYGTASGFWGYPGPDDAIFWSDIIDGKYPYNPRKTSLIEKEDREKYKNFLPKNGKRNKVIDYLKCFYSDTEVKEDIINYMIPLVCTDLPIEPIEAIKFFDIKDFEQLDIIEQTRLFWFYKFYKYRIGKLKNIKPSAKRKQLENYQALLQKYLVGKEITILPSGIKISVNGKSISLNELASGEKKIILLFALACLCDNLEILLDEPELSLSIVWQEDLLVDMLSSNRNFYTIATHSPYMVAKEEIQKYIIFLPTEEQSNDDK